MVTVFIYVVCTRDLWFILVIVSDSYAQAATAKEAAHASQIAADESLAAAKRVLIKFYIDGV